MEKRRYLQPKTKDLQALNLASILMSSTGGNEDPENEEL